MRTAVCLGLAVLVAIAAGWQVGDTATSLVGQKYGAFLGLPFGMFLGAATGRAFGRLARTPELD